MKVHQMTRVMHDEPHSEPEPYYETHLFLTYMTKREFINALKLLDELKPKLDVVNKEVSK